MSNDRIQFKMLPKQKQCLLSPADTILFGGSAGSAKSACVMLMAVYYAYNQPNCEIAIFRRTYGALLATFMQGEFSLPNILAPFIERKLCTINWSKMTISWYNGSVIALCHCANDKDMYIYQGAAWQALFIDEAGQFTEPVVRYLKSRVRSSIELRPEFENILPKTVYTANPDGPLFSYLKRNFVTFCEGDKPTLYDKEYKETRQYIGGTLADNPYLNEDYAENLKSLGSPALVQAYLNGDWSVSLSGFFDGTFTEDNVCAPFKIPSNWTKVRGFDFGYSAPYSVLWMAESNGEAITRADGTVVQTIRGDRFIFMEEYGDDGAEKGLKQTAEEIAHVILKAEQHAANSLYSGKIQPGAADSAIYTKESNGNSVADNMKKAGVKFVPCTKGPGSRVNGWQQVMSLFKKGYAQPREHAGLFIFSSCKRLIDHLKTLPRDPKKLDDCDTNASDHDADCLRYLCTTKKTVVKTRQF